MPHRRSDVDELVRDVLVRFGRELRLAASGLPQREIARRAGVSQSLVSRSTRAIVMPDLELMVRLAAAVGHRFAFKLYPDDGVGLRDSGQLELANIVARAAHAAWRIAFEVPVALPPDRRAADMVLEHRLETVELEIERGLYDFQAQFRAAQLKRTALSERLGRSVALVIGVPDSDTARRKLRPHAAAIRTTLPVSSRRAWASLRSGEPVGGDALLWIRRADPMHRMHPTALQGTQRR
jgi:transcriptional regulator with XRE-family HTH domain